MEQQVILNFILGAGVLLAMGFHHYNKRRKGIKGFGAGDAMFYIPIIIFGILYFYAIYNQEAKKKEAVTAFNSTKEIACVDKSRNVYQVSQNNEWQLDGKHFVKGDIAVSAVTCRVL